MEGKPSRPEKLRALPIRLRKATESDVPFIFNSWLKSYRDSWFSKTQTSTMYYTEHHKILEKLLRTCEIFVACNNKDPGELYGWACGETRDNIFVLHYIYVKHTFRMIGLGKLILGQFTHNPEHASIYTHHTKYADRLADKFRMFHNPYIALTEEYRKLPDTLPINTQKQEESSNEPTTDPKSE